MRYWVLSLVLLVNCHSNTKDKDPIPKVMGKKTSIEKQEPYQLDTFDEVYLLDQQLVEISGLSFDESQNVIWSINDEKGHVYKLSIQDGRILEDLKFAKKGDFEGVCVVGDKLVVTKFNGDLYFFDPLKKKTEKVKTSLSGKNNVEGLTYDPEGERLLLALKGSGVETKAQNKKYLYSFDLSSQKILDEPFIIISDHDLKAYVNDHFSFSKTRMKKMLNRASKFSPSGVAINPVSKNIFICSAKGSLVVICTPSGEISKVYFLDEKVVPQPEGICFDDQGTLYLSSEGHGYSGKLFKYFRKTD